jgi:hypothetical protein
MGLLENVGKKFRKETPKKTPSNKELAKEKTYQRKQEGANIVEALNKKNEKPIEERNPYVKAGLNMMSYLRKEKLLEETPKPYSFKELRKELENTFAGVIYGDLMDEDLIDQSDAMKIVHEYYNSNLSSEDTKKILAKAKTKIEQEKALANQRKAWKKEYLEIYREREALNKDI